jgi:hypothetical protein
MRFTLTVIILQPGNHLIIKPSKGEVKGRVLPILVTV